MSLLRGTLAPCSFLLTSLLLWLWPLRGQNTIRKNVLDHSLRGAECEFYDPQTHHPAVSDAVHDPAVVGRCVAARALWHLGYPEQARQHLDTAFTRAQELAHPFTLAQVFYCATTFALLRREVQVAGEQAEELITLATAQGFPFELAGGMLCRGLVLIEQGQQA